MAPLLEARDLCSADQEPTPLRGLSIAFARGTFSLLTGADGGGKNRLLRLLGLLEMPASGEVFFDGRATSALADSEREQLRNTRFGYLFSSPFLLPSLSVVENVAMPLFRISHSEPDEARVRTSELLEFTHLADHSIARVGDLSPAEQQRTALARALANRPALLIAEAVAPAIAALLRLACVRFDVTVIASVPRDFPTEPADRVIEIDGGAVRAPHPLDA